MQNAGPNGTGIGFATVNVWFHQMTGEHMLIYTITDWLGLIPIFICMCFGILGLARLVKQRNLLRKINGTAARTDHEMNDGLTGQQK